MATRARSNFNETENLHGLFSYISPSDRIAMGFMIRLAEPQAEGYIEAHLMSKALDSILSMVHCWANATNNEAKIDEVDFDLCEEGAIRLIMTPQTQQKLKDSDGNAFLMLRDHGNFKKTLAILNKASEDGKPPLIELDVIPDLDGELQLLEFFGEMTGEMS